jgi:putative hemolysin
VRALILTLPIAMIVTACGGEDDGPTATTAPGLANPASEYCVDQGGELEIVPEPAGQVGYCHLPDGTRVEEWEYFRAQTGSTTVP